MWILRKHICVYTEDRKEKRMWKKWFFFKFFCTTIVFLIYFQLDNHNLDILQITLADDDFYWINLSYILNLLTKISTKQLPPTQAFMIQLDINHITSRGGDSAYERGGDARRKFWIKPLKETDLGVAHKRDHVKTQAT